MGQATFLDLIKAIRRLSPKEIIRNLEIYYWEIAGYIILSFISSLFVDLISVTFIYLTCSYFWSWALASPKLIWKTEHKKYRFSLLRGIVSVERKMREGFLFNAFRTSPLYRPLGRILSALFLSLLVSLALKQFVMHIFFLGSVLFELIRSLKYYEKS
jgi:hypothetical protein